MLLRDEKTGRLKKQPAKIGDKVIMFVGSKPTNQSPDGIVKCEQDYHYGIATMYGNDFMATGWSIKE